MPFFHVYKRLDSATLSIDQYKEDNMNYYVLRPDLTPYEGMVVNKDSKLTFENEKVKQELKDLKLVTIQTITADKYTSKSELTINLDEGDVLLFENEGRGWFLPAQSIGTIKTAIQDYESLASALDGDK